MKSIFSFSVNIIPMQLIPLPLHHALGVIDWAAKLLSNDIDNQSQSKTNQHE